MRFYLFVLTLVGLSAVAGFITANTSPAADDWILGVAGAVVLTAAVASAWRTRNLFAGLVILPPAVAAALIANFLPYVIGFWGLSTADYGSDNQPAFARLALLLAWSTLGTIALALAIGLVTDAAHYLRDRAEPETADDATPAGSLRPS